MTHARAVNGLSLQLQVYKSLTQCRMRHCFSANKLALTSAVPQAPPPSTPTGTRSAVCDAIVLEFQQHCAQVVVVSSGALCRKSEAS